MITASSFTKCDRRPWHVRRRARADEHIGALRTQAETAASEHEHCANHLIRRMLELGKPPKAIADALGTPLAHVREIQRSTPQQPTTTRNTT